MPEVKVDRCKESPELHPTPSRALTPQKLHSQVDAAGSREDVFLGHDGAAADVPRLQEALVLHRYLQQEGGW